MCRYTMRHTIGIGSLLSQILAVGLAGRRDVWYSIRLAPHPTDTPDSICPAIAAEAIVCFQRSSTPCAVPCPYAMRHRARIGSSPSHPLAVGLAGCLLLDEMRMV
jgi:hypothetical protein